MRKLLQRLWDIAADFAYGRPRHAPCLAAKASFFARRGACAHGSRSGAVRAESQLVDGCPSMLCLLLPQTHLGCGGGRDVHGRAQPCHALAALHSGRPCCGRGPRFFHEALLRAGRCVAIFPEGRSTRRKRSCRSSRARRCWPCRPECRSSPPTARGTISRPPAAAARVRRAHRKADAAAERRGRAGGDAVPAGGHGAPAGGALSGDETEISDARG